MQLTRHLVCRTFDYTFHGARGPWSPSLVMEVHSRSIDRRVQRQRDTAINADGRIENAVQVAERNRTLGHFVDQEAERVALQIEQYTDGAARCDAPFDATFVDRIVLEPGSLAIDVHGETFVVFAWRVRKWYGISLLKTKNKIK